MTGKTRECYWQAFNWLAMEVPDLNPRYIGVDFELAFFSTARAHFEEAILIGCKFHFKQAILKHLKGLGIKPSQWSFAMRQGVIDLLMVIPPSQLQDGVLFVRHMIMDYIMELDDYEDSDAELWDEFWDGYFNP